MRKLSFTLFALGKVDSLFSFKNIFTKENLNKVISFRTVPDALNYMASLGWTLTTSTVDHSYLQKFYFKREFDRSELTIY